MLKMDVLHWLKSNWLDANWLLCVRRPTESFPFRLRWARLRWNWIRTMLFPFVVSFIARSGSQPDRQWMPLWMVDLMVAGWKYFLFISLTPPLSPCLSPLSVCHSPICECVCVCVCACAFADPLKFSQFSFEKCTKDFAFHVLIFTFLIRLCNLCTQYEWW